MKRKIIIVLIVGIGIVYLLSVLPSVLSVYYAYVSRNEFKKMGIEKTTNKHTEMKDKVDSSVIKLWNSFIKEHPEHKGKVMPDSWYFCDNKKDADECAELVVQGIKRATSTSLWWYETHQHPLPVIGDLYIITNWEGKAKAIIETTKVTPVKYKDITEEYAAIEGEGDKTLAYWKKVHWAYYTREMQEKGAQPSMDMTIICEQFKTVWTQKQAGI